MLSGFSRAAAAASVCIGLCALAGFTTEAGATTETVIYSFQDNGKDGYFPGAVLINADGVLYGTTQYGGTGRCINGCGAIFSVAPATGSESVLYSFRGDQPARPSSLIKVGNQLFGTTAQGGHRHEGSLFSLDLTSGAFSTQYSFCNLFDCSDGSAPDTGLLAWNGTLFGAARSEPNANGNGLVFSFDPQTGTETSIHDFCNHTGCKDGALPQGGMVHSGKKLYGVALIGGHGCQQYSQGGCGVVYRLDPTGESQTAIYSFCSQQGCSDGAYPTGAMTKAGGMFYGITQYGGIGTFSCVSYLPGCGVVFGIDPATHTETVLHAFAADGSDGLQPVGGVIEVNGLLYGTTENGGAQGKGTVYSVDPSTGAEKIVYSFCSQTGCTDGSTPEAGLVNVNGTLYGTTVSGGAGGCDGAGCGTVFAITP